MKEQVLLIGWGNTAQFFAQRISQSKQFEVAAIATRKLIKNCPFNNISIEEISLNFDGIILICISDDAIKTIAEKLKNHTAIIAHCAGSVSIDVLGAIKNPAVFYPLQTLSTLEENAFPLLIESKNEVDLQTLTHLAQNMGLNPQIMNSEERLKLHLAATMSNNFTHYLLSNIKHFLSENKLEAELLKPLLYKTINLFFDQQNDSFALQTGPAKRKDQTSINKHLSLLQQEQDLLKLYQFFTEEIRKKYN